MSRYGEQAVAPSPVDRMMADVAAEVRPPLSTVLDQADQEFGNTAMVESGGGVKGPPLGCSRHRAG